MWYHTTLHPVPSAKSTQTQAHFETTISKIEVSTELYILSYIYIYP